MSFNMDIGTFIIAVVGAWIAYSQLNKINIQIGIAVENQRTDSLKIVLEIETQMNSRKLEFDKAAKSVREAHNKGTLDEDALDILRDYFNATKESYLNALDRLCYCIEKEYISDKDWRAEYRNLVHEIISAYEEDFGEASPYNNIKKTNREFFYFCSIIDRFECQIPKIFPFGEICRTRNPPPIKNLDLIGGGLSYNTPKFSACGGLL